MPLVEFVDIFINEFMYVNAAPRPVRQVGSKIAINQVTTKKRKRDMNSHEPLETLEYPKMEDDIITPKPKSDYHEEVEQ